MKKETKSRSFLAATVLIVAMSFVLPPLSADTQDFEVWAIDQSGTAGKLYIYDGLGLNDEAGTAVPEVVDLGGAVTALCQAQTASAPVRAHMLMFDPTDTVAILAYVASGHVVFIDAVTRTPLSCIDVGAQAHAAFPSPDGSYVVVANQSGELLQRISTDYETNTFILDNSATINLATCTTPNGAACKDATLRPDNAPICPVVASDSRLVFVTLRGGGMFVVDGTTTPMNIVAEYDKATVHPNGCGGLEKSGKMYINSGGGTAANPTESDLFSFPLSGYPSTGFNAPNTPAPTTIFSKDTGNHDSHGAVLNVAKDGRYLWVADRFANEIEVVDTTTDSLVNTFSLTGRHSSDPAPDLMGIAPGGGYAFVSLRGPCPLTANALAVNNAVGATPGVGVLAIQQAGFKGKLVAVAPISNPSAPFTCATVGGSPTLSERADPHALQVRIT